MDGGGWDEYDRWRWEKKQLQDSLAEGMRRVTVLLDWAGNEPAGSVDVEQCRYARAEAHKWLLEAQKLVQ